jgi:hypothetical protein
MYQQELPDDLKAHLDRIRTKNNIGDGGRQSLACDLSQVPMLRSIFKQNVYKDDGDFDEDCDLSDTPLDEIPLDRRPFEYLEIKTGQTLDGDEAREIVGKGTVFAVIKVGKIDVLAKQIFRAAGIIYVENVSVREIDNWRNTQTSWFNQ